MPSGVSDDEKVAANMWIDYLREEQQQRAFMRAGFRAVSNFPIAANDIDDRVKPEFGLSKSSVTKTLDVSKIALDVAREIDAQWETMKRPGILTFVVDTSGSMLIGGKLDKAKDGITRGLTTMASNNLVGLVSFDDVVRQESTVGTITKGEAGDSDHLKSRKKASEREAEVKHLSTMPSSWV